MNLKSIIRQCLSKDWLLALLILGIYLATNRYIYGWDDQHLEIPLLKHLIDPTLFQGDYYVESLTKNFTSFLYPILSRVISVDQIPAVYLTLFILSRYFLFYWWLKLWRLLAVRSLLGSGEDRNTALVAFSCVLYAIVLGRTEEFLYRTFSHQEFTLAIVFAAVYFFFKDRFVLAAVLFGLAANFHALYSLFPMVYMIFYLLFFHKERNIEYTLKTGFTFALFCFPFLFWTLSKTIESKTGVDPQAFSDWVQIYLLACPQNFPFAAQSLGNIFSNLGTSLKALNPFLTLISLYLYNYYANDHFRRDRKIHAISLCAALLIGACFYFAYVAPNKFILDLNLIRNEQYLRFFLLGYLVISATRMLQIKNLFWTVFAGVVFVVASRQDLLGVIPLNLCIALMILLKIRTNHWEETKPLMYTIAGVLVALSVAQAMSIDVKDLGNLKWNNPVWLILIPFLYGIFAKCSGRTKRGRMILIVLPIMLMGTHYIHHHYRYVEVTTKGEGFWQLQRNWEDMQRYVQKNTPKEAMLLVPYNMEMCGFRIQSERKILVSYRDCGIVGFDYMAVKEWQQRIADIKEFKVFVDPKTIAPAIVKALTKYKVDYIVFMRYYAPGDNEVVKKIYENEIFALYQVIKDRNSQ